MCRQLNMEDAVEEIMIQLGADDSGRISFDEFLQCRMRLITEIEHERLKDRGFSTLAHWHSHPHGKALFTVFMKHSKCLAKGSILKVSHHRCTRGAGKQCSGCIQLLN